MDKPVYRMLSSVGLAIVLGLNFLQTLTTQVVSPLTNETSQVSKLPELDKVVTVSIVLYFVFISASYIKAQTNKLN